MSEENKLPEEENPEITSNAGTGTPAAKPAPKVVTEEADEDAKYMTRAEYERAKLNQNLPVGIIAGLVTGIVCAGIWAAIAVFTGIIHSFMAILVGLAVGFVIRFTGKGVESKFGIVGAFIALLSCALGNFLSTIGFLASEMNADFFYILFNFDYSFLPDIMRADFEWIDVVFYGFAILAGFGASFHTVKVID